MQAILPEFVDYPQHRHALGRRERTHNRHCSNPASRAPYAAAGKTSSIGFSGRPLDLRWLRAAHTFDFLFLHAIGHRLSLDYCKITSIISKSAILPLNPGNLQFLALHAAEIG